ncbi:MAG: primosomal protein N', partial [Candidatus Puniceispirillaceae bacterium]
ALRQIDATRPQFHAVQIFGPAFAPIGFLKGKHRARLLIRADKGVNIQHILKGWLGAIKLPSSVRMQIDIDPYSFL